MKKTILIIITGFISGIGGSWFYENYIPNSFLAPQDYATTILNKENLNSNNISSISNSADPSEEANDIKSENIVDILRPTDFILASKVSTKSVVYIKTISQNRYGSTWMDWFFGEGVGQSISSGSGVIYSRDGYIITNNHVVNDANSIEVIIGKKAYEATLIGADESSDLAVLRIETTGIPEIKLASSKEVEVGEWVLAVGNPFNLTSTVTAGIVSGKGRELNILKSTFPLESFIQTDAAINPGNSGGALVNLSGELIGINTAILSKTGSYSGYGFAVPSDIVKKVVDDLIKYGEVQKAFFGAEALDIDTDIATKLETDDYSGVVLSYVQEDGAAAQIGMQKGDIILKIDGEPINSRSHFEEILSYHSPGEQITVVYKQNQKIVQNSITLTNREGTTELLKREVYTSRTLGADLEKVSKVERSLLNIEHGVRVLKVRNGLIGQMDIPEGFIITYINKVAITDPETLTDILTKIKGRVFLEGINKRGNVEYYRYYF